MNASTLPTALTIDVRPMPPRDRHGTIFTTFQAMPVGESLDVVSDHDPRPLRQQFEHDVPGTYSWTYLEFGPDTWRVRIHKLALSRSGGGCCGHCGGGH